MTVSNINNNNNNKAIKKIVRKYQPHAIYSFYDKMIECSFKKLINISLW